MKFIQALVFVWNFRGISFGWWNYPVCLTNIPCNCATCINLQVQRRQKNSQTVDQLAALLLDSLGNLDNPETRIKETLVIKPKLILDNLKEPEIKDMLRMGNKSWFSLTRKIVHKRMHRIRGYGRISMAYIWYMAYICKAAVKWWHKLRR